MSNHPLRPRPLAIERLERRELRAGDVVARVEGQMLIIWGDAADNGVILTYNSATQGYRVVGKEAGGAPTTINGLSTPEEFEFTGVKQVYVGLNGGNDDFEVGSPAAVDTVIRQWLSIEMGDGDDRVTLGVAGNASGGAAPVARSLDIGTSLQINLGAGSDQLSLANAEIGLALNVWAGDGNDKVHFDTDFTPAGASAATFYPVLVRGNTAIQLGGGEDELEVHNAILRSHLLILDGGGPAQIDLYNLNIGKKLDIDTGNEADEIGIRFVFATQFTLDSNGGVDDVDVEDCRFKTMIVKLGPERDQLLLRRVRVSWLTRLDGGAAGSAFTRGPGNQLRGLTRRNIG